MKLRAIFLKDKVDKFLAELRKRENLNKIINKRGKITTDIAEI